MTERETESRRSKPRARAPGAARYLYGTLLVAIGACVGIVIGSLSETPRLLLERVRGPVETVDLEPSAPDAPKSPPPLEAFGELQTGAKPKAEPVVTAAAPPASAPAAVGSAHPASPPPVARPPAPAVASTPPVASAPPKPAPAKSADELVRALEKKNAPEGRGAVIQVLSLAERQQADAMLAKLKSQGFDPYMTAMPDKSGRFRVRVRPSAGQSAPELEQKLKALGFKTWTTLE
ncbi:MAG: SPOR domain-containing protein [Myxococcota bacterium]